MSSNTGNNHVSSGTITQAASTNSIDVHTEVNGKVIEDYHASSTKPIEYHSSYSTSSSDVYRLEKKIQKHVRESSALFVASTSSASIAHASATKKRLDSSRGDFIKSIQLLVAYIFNYATSQL